MLKQILKKVRFFGSYMRSAKTFRFFILFLIAIPGLPSFGQRFDSILNKLDKEYPQEKVYLQFDRKLYYAGETIWFKAYLFAGNDRSLISKTLYTELIDEKGNILETKTAPLMTSSAQGFFDVPIGFKGNSVYVRSYTKWMLNFDSSFVFLKQIPVLNRTATVKANPVANEYTLQFFPEGGDLVTSINSNVAFKSVDKRGYPFKVTGDIIDQAGKKIIHFSSIHDGMGIFNIQATGETSYKALWKDVLGIAHETALPTPKKAGVAIQVVNNGKSLTFKVTRSTDPNIRYEEVYVVAQAQQQLVYRAKANLSDLTSIKGSIPIDQLPAGILQVTVFDRYQQPVAERIVFVNQQDYFFITDLNAASVDLGKRKKNVIQVDVPDTLRCNLSLAVTDADLDTENQNSGDIYSSVLLTSDIKGYVHNPSYYFSSEADSVAKHLDLVMMTNGWRRFRWEDVIAGQFPVIRYKPENYISIEGNVYGIPRGSLANRELTGILELKNKNKHIMTAPVRPDGSFTIPGLIFYDTAHVYYQFNNDKDKRLTSRATFELRNNMISNRLNIVKDDTWKNKTYNSFDSSIRVKNKEASDRFISDLGSGQQTKVLKTIDIKGRQKSKKQQMDEEYASGFFRGGDDITFIMEDDPNSSSSFSILNYLQSRVAGLDIKVGNGTPSLSWRGGTPALFLNELQNDIESIQNIPMSDVAMIKVFRPPFFGASGGGSGGAIAVYLKKGASANGNVKGLDFSAIGGYSPMREFYTPDYSKSDQSVSQQDIRTTLYWNPYVLTDKDHRKILLSFYNNDFSKKLRVIIEGVNEEGKLTRIEKVFK